MSEIRNALNAAREVIRNEQITSLPVDVEQIAQKHAHVLRRELDDKLSGMLVPLNPPVAGKRWVIVVNALHPDVRQRFTIAHELGHLLLHGYTHPHADTRFRIRLNGGSSTTTEDIEEIQANRFAAELLMPQHLIVPRLDLDLLEYASTTGQAEALPLAQLAHEFAVSQQALSIRLAHLLA